MFNPPFCLKIKLMRYYLIKIDISVRILLGNSQICLAVYVVDNNFMVYFTVLYYRT